MITLRLIVIVLSAGILAACEQDAQYSDLRVKMDMIKQRPKGHITAPPEFKAYKSFTYSAASIRSPFSPPLTVEMNNMPKGQPGVLPDFDRVKEVLESFSIDALTMVGTLKRPEGALFALVKDSDNGLHRVAVGNHMGRNFGEVLSVSARRVDVMEIVSDGQDGWIERPRAIVIAE